MRIPGMMDFRSLRIVYMGTPEFAVAPLETLLNAGCTVPAVITAPDKPAGRGRKIRPSAVKEFALEKDLPLMQPANLKDPGFNESLRKLEPDLQVVVAFRMLPESVWQIPGLGTINLHASLLPKYQGHSILTSPLRFEVTTNREMAVRSVPGAKRRAGSLLVPVQTRIPPSPPFRFPCHNPAPRVPADPSEL